MGGAGSVITISRRRQQGFIGAAEQVMMGFVVDSEGRGRTRGAVLCCVLWPIGRQDCSAQTGREGTGRIAVNGAAPQTGGGANRRAPETGESESNVIPGGERDR